MQNGTVILNRPSQLPDINPVDNFKELNQPK